MFGAKMRARATVRTAPCLARFLLLRSVGRMLAPNRMLNAMRETSSVSAAIVRRSIIIGNQQPCLALCGPEHLHGGTDLGA